MAGFGKRIVGLNAVPSVVNTAQGRDAWGGQDRWVDGQVFVRPDHPYPIVRMMFWDQSKGGNGGLYVNAKGIVRPALIHSDLTKGSHGVKCEDKELIKPNDANYDPMTCWHDAMDFSDALHMAQNMAQIRIDHLIGVPDSIASAEDMAFYSLKIVGIDVKNDKDLPNGWDKTWENANDLTPLVRHAMKVKRFDALKQLRDEGVTLNKGRWLAPPNISTHLSAPNLQDSERKNRREIQSKIAAQVALWNELRDLFVNC